MLYISNLYIEFYISSNTIHPLSWNRKSNLYWFTIAFTEFHFGKRLVFLANRIVKSFLISKFPMTKLINTIVNYTIRLFVYVRLKIYWGKVDFGFDQIEHRWNIEFIRSSLQPFMRHVSAISILKRGTIIKMILTMTAIYRHCSNASALRRNHH